MKFLFILFITLFMGNSFAQNYQELPLTKFIEDILKYSGLEPIWDKDSYLYYSSFVSYVPSHDNDKFHNQTVEELSQDMKRINSKLIEYNIAPLEMKIFTDHKVFISSVGLKNYSYQ